jgi:glycosyltransferase involved in cell wall biosynthesis
LPVQIIKFFEFLVKVVLRCREVDCLHCNDLNALVVGCVCRLFNSRLKVVYDAHEFEANQVPNQSRLSIRLHSAIERLFIRRADAVITVSGSIASAYARIYGIAKPYLVLNCPNYTEQAKTDTLRRVFNLDRTQKIFLYQGALAAGRGVEIMLEAFSRRRDRACVLVCMGYGPLESLVRERSKDGDNVFFHPAVSPDALPAYTSSADYGISFIEDLCLSYRYCLPNKLFEYLMAGIPVLVSNLVEMKGFVEAEGVGAVADDNSVDGFLGAVDSLLRMDDAGLRGRVRAASRRYCWENQETVLRDVYGSLGR